MFVCRDLSDVDVVLVLCGFGCTIINSFLCLCSRDGRALQALRFMNLRPVGSAAVLRLLWRKHVSGFHCTHVQ